MGGYRGVMGGRGRNLVWIGRWCFVIFVISFGEEGEESLVVFSAHAIRISDEMMIFSLLA